MYINAFKTHQWLKNTHWQSLWNFYCRNIEFRHTNTVRARKYTEKNNKPRSQKNYHLEM